MTETPRVSVVVALLNEEYTVTELVERTRSALEARAISFEILLIDDGSRDHTCRMARQLEESDARVHVFELSRNFGQNAALACGLFSARGDIVVTMDGDLQNPPEEIPRLVEAIDRPGLLATGRRGARYETTLRWLGSRAIHWLARWLTGAQIEDFGGNFRAYQREVIEAMRQVWAAGKPLLPLALWLGYPVVEVTVRHDVRTRGETHYSIGRLLRINLDLILGFTTLPLTLLGLVGLIALASGGVGVLWAVLSERPSGLWAAIWLSLTIIGAVFFSAGVLGQYLAKLYWLAAGKGPAYVIKRGPRADPA